MKETSNYILLLFIILIILFGNIVFAQEEPPDMGNISGDVFGKKAEWYHAYLSLYEAYDDNIFNTEKETESDYITVLSPGIQLTIPGTDQRAEEIVTSTTAPGGLTFGRFEKSSFRRFRAYLGYAPWFQFYSDHDRQNVINHYAQAGLQYNLRGGISFDIADRFDKNYDRSEANTSTKSDSYYSNLVILTATYPISEKLRLRADCSNFRVKYTDDVKNGLRNRKDNSAAGYLFFRFRPKTAVYLKYQYTNITYRDDKYRNGETLDYLAGMRWEFTSKTDFNIQAGYENRSFEGSNLEDSNGFVYELGVNYQLSAKIRITANAYQRNEEWKVVGYDSTMTTAGSLKYLHSITSKVDFELDFSCNHRAYEGSSDELIDVPDADETFFTVTPSLTYALQPWLSASAAYSYRDRDSDIEDDSFRGNTVVFKITGAI